MEKDQNRLEIGSQKEIERLIPQLRFVNVYGGEMDRLVTGKYVKLGRYVQIPEDGVYVARIVKDTAPGERRGVHIVIPLKPFWISSVYHGVEYRQPAIGCARDIAEPHSKWWKSYGPGEMRDTSLKAALKYFRQKYPELDLSSDSCPEEIYEALYSDGGFVRVREPTEVKLHVGDKTIFSLALVAYGNENFIPWAEFNGSMAVRQERLKAATEMGEMMGHTMENIASRIIVSPAWYSIAKAVTLEK